MKCKIGLPVILYLLFLTSCEKAALTNIDLGNGTNSYELVIEGGINTLQQNQFIRLTKPAVLPNQVPQPISQAVLLVNDGSQDVPFKETLVPGVYTANFLNKANYNHVYTLKVTSNHKQFVAFDTLKTARPIEAHYLPLTTTLLNDGQVRLSIPKHTFGVAIPQQWLIIYKGMAAWQPQEFDTKFSYSYSHVFGSPNALYPLTQESRTVDLNLNESARNIQAVSDLNKYLAQPCALSSNHLMLKALYHFE